jgi:predicted DNA-binding transcriptional regulator AlpA
MVTAKTKYNPENTHCMGSEPNQTPSSEAGFIDQKQLLARLPISRRTLFNWRTSGTIPCVRLGGRRILFHWPSVEAALLRYQRGGVE